MNFFFHKLRESYPKNLYLYVLTDTKRKKKINRSRQNFKLMLIFHLFVHIWVDNCVLQIFLFMEFQYFFSDIKNFEQKIKNSLISKIKYNSSIKSGTIIVFIVNNIVAICIYQLNSH